MAITLDQTIAQRQHNWRSSLLAHQTFWVLLVIIAYSLFLYFTTNAFGTGANLYNITRNFTFTAIIALGMTLVIITGGIDLSVGSVLCLCSMVLAVTMHGDVTFGPYNWLTPLGLEGPYTVCEGGCSINTGIAAALATALLVGAFNGIMIAYVGFPPFVVTLGMLSIARSLGMIASNNQTVFQFGPDHEKLLALGGGANLAGGIGTASGALVGAALIEIIRNSLGLLGINAFWQGTFIGGFIVIAVGFDRLRRSR